MLVLLDASYPNRIQVLLGSIQGPFSSSALGVLDPRRDFEVYVDGAPLTLVTYSFDAVNNRYLIFSSQPFNVSGLVQVVYHIPAIPFVSSSGVVLPGFASVGIPNPNPVDQDTQPTAIIGLTIPVAVGNPTIYSTLGIRAVPQAILTIPTFFVNAGIAAAGTGFGDGTFGAGGFGTLTPDTSADFGDGKFGAGGFGTGDGSITGIGVGYGQGGYGIGGWGGAVIGSGAGLLGFGSGSFGSGAFGTGTLDPVGLYWVAQSVPFIRIQGSNGFDSGFIASTGLFGSVELMDLVPPSSQTYTITAYGPTLAPLTSNGVVFSMSINLNVTD